MNYQDIINRIEKLRKNFSNAIPKRELFSLAKEFKAISVSDVVELLRNKNYDYRITAVSILDWKARDNKSSQAERKDFYKAYIDNHDWIDDWGLVDRAAPYVVGGYLFDKSRAPLYKLAKSKNASERRTAIVSTYFFIRKNEIEETFKIAEILVNDSDDYVQKAVGSWIREAGKRDESRLKIFLDNYAATMPRITLRYAIEKFDRETKEYYFGMKGK